MTSYFHLETLLPRLVAFLIAMTVHDASHLFTAWLLGDRSAREHYKLSLNPLARLDALGLAMVLFGPYGWSKSLTIRKEHFQKYPRLYHTLVYAAGPLSNLLLVFFFWWLYFYLPAWDTGKIENFSIEMWKVYIQYGIIVNVMLVLIHILPLYPLDGWHIVRGLLPAQKQGWFQRNERYGLLLVLILLITPIGQWALEHVYPVAAQAVMNVFSL
ncbi:site-2 protease family protein [Paenibacillus hexagrammi]|uniref:Site-2 protease family protein n=1 Tax=Paenibacillus hexagrammi TaxID=2908839 RepID=A0ABY3SCH7_9BACL|nr:site-2 protease family protein [Paenibacillus sp. YPD9-1]UJF31185.1 site-2 protease family protein [Paenibacillus sp. YPD9-1]